MIERKWLQSTKLLDKVSSATESNPYPIEDYANMMLTVAGGENATATIKVVGSFQIEAPDFSQSADEDNQWSYISVRNLEDGTNIDGTVGIDLTTSGVESYLVNTPWLRWIGVVITSYTGGEITVSLNGFSS